MLPEGQKHNYCRECSAEYARERRNLPHVKARTVGAYRRRHYGITPEQYEAMVEAVGGLCAICGQPERATRRGEIRGLNVDHDHDTGAVRGLLCSNCNTAIGLLRDDPVRLQAAIVYLS